MCQASNHQGVAIKLSRPSINGPFNIEKFLLISKKPIILIIDNVQDPHNFGSIARSALAFGINHIFIPKKRSAGISPGSIRSSAGAIHSLNIVRVSNISNLIEKLKKKNFWIYGLKGKVSHKVNIDFNKNRKALVVGSEHDGISNIVESKLDYILEIPMEFEKIDSLNASVAASIAMFQIYNN